MKIGIFQITLDEILAFECRLERYVEQEFKGLGVKGTRVKPTSSDFCTLYALRNTALVQKYGVRYAIIAFDSRVLEETVKLLKIKHVERIDL